MLFLDNAAPDSCCAERPLHIPTYPRLAFTAARVKGGGSLSSLVQLSTSLLFSPVPRLLPPHEIIPWVFALGRVKGQTWRAEYCVRARARKMRSLGTRLGFCVGEASSFWGPGGKFPHNCILVAPQRRCRMIKQLQSHAFSCEVGLRTGN